MACEPAELKSERLVFIDETGARPTWRALRRCPRASASFAACVIDGLRSLLARETQAKFVASGRALAAAQAEIAALKSAMEKLNSELAQMKAKVEPTIKK